MSESCCPRNVRLQFVTAVAAQASSIMPAGGPSSPDAGGTAAAVVLWQNTRVLLELALVLLGAGERWGQEYAAQSGTPFGMSRKTFIGPDGRPCGEQPWGALAAIDVSTGKLRWETPMLPSLGGPMAVNRVVFFGGTVFETRLRAFAADDGRKLWKADLPFSAHSVPSTYEWEGKRYVVVCAGGHGKVDGSKLGGTVIAFAVE